MAAIDYVHQPHPHTEKRKLKEPPKIADEHIGFNGRVGATITRSVGTMWAVYIAFFIQVTWMALATIGVWELKKDPYPFAFLLFLSNIVQLLLMFVIWFVARTALRAFIVLAQSLLQLVIPTVAALWIAAASSVIVGSLVNPLLQIAIVLIYFDLRVRREALDLFQLAQRVSSPQPAQ